MKRRKRTTTKKFRLPKRTSLPPVKWKKAKAKDFLKPNKLYEDMKFKCDVCGATDPKELDVCPECHAPVPTARLISEKEKQHGYWPNTAETAQQLKQIMHQSYNWRNGNLSFSRREAIEMVCIKLARIGSGDVNLPDHWKDGGGYFWLGEQEWK